MKHVRLLTSVLPATMLAIVLLVTASGTRAQAPSKVAVSIAVTKDDAICPDAKVVIKPRGIVVAWPADKDRMEFKTDARGRVSTRLGTGIYLIRAYDPENTRLPDDVVLTISHGQEKTAHIHLNLLYWDCSKVRCLL